MKRNFIAQLTSIGLILIMAVSPKTNGQDSITQKSQMLDIKLQLLDSKLELLDSKIKLWEAKPKELDVRLMELNSKIKSLDFEPAEMTKKIHEIDSMLRIRQTQTIAAEAKQNEVRQADMPSEPLFIPDYNSAIMLDPLRLIEGTFCISYERILNPRYSLNVSGMATYSTKQGISNIYFSNQSFAFFDATSNQYHSYKGEVMSGGGFNVQLRNYLLASHPNRQRSPLGLYAAPQLMYRNMKITGYYQQMEETSPGVNQLVDKQIVQHLDIFAGGAIIGMKIPLFKVLAIDIFAGGNIRLSKYSNEKGFTKYKDMFNVDFSGVSPVAGIAIGILK